MNDRDEFIKNWCSGICNQDCWGVAIGEGTGSSFSLQIGKRLKRSRPLTNPHINQAQKDYYSYYGLQIGGAAWRLTCDKDMLVSWEDDNSNGGPMVRTMKKLVGLDVIKVDLDEIFYDLSICFSNNYKLNVFCDQSICLLENYSISIDKLYLSIGPGCKLNFES